MPTALLRAPRRLPRSRSTAFSGSPLSGTFAVRDGHLAIVCNAREQTLGLLAALGPAWRAARIPPAEATRSV